MSARKMVVVMLAIALVSALIATSASAEETLLAFWLWNNVAVTELLSVTVLGRIVIKDDETLVGSAGLSCRVTTDGSVGESGEDEITSILTVLGLETGELGHTALLGTGAASGEGSECKTVEACAEGTAASPLEVNPLGLPWHTQLFLMENGTFLVLISSLSGFIGYELLCLVLGVNAEDKCMAQANDFEFEVINDPENAAIPTNSEMTPPGICSQSGKATGHNTFEELTEIVPLTGLLSVSSEP